MIISKLCYFIRVCHLAGSPADLANYTPPCARAGVYFTNKPANWRAGEAANRPADHLNCYIHTHPRICACMCIRKEVVSRSGGRPLFQKKCIIRIGAMRQITVPNSRVAKCKTLLQTD